MNALEQRFLPMLSRRHIRKDAVIEAIQDEINTQVKEAMRIAKVVITVKKFKDVINVDATGTERGVDHVMDMKRLKHPHKRVSVDKLANPRALHIKPGGATILFEILAPGKAKKKDVYYPLGIAFVLKKGLTNNGTPDADRLGRLNFTQSKIVAENNTILVTDSFKDGNSDNRYEFSIIIQRKSDGAVGIIDPPIIHDPY